MKKMKLFSRVILLKIERYLLITIALSQNTPKLKITEMLSKVAMGNLAKPLNAALESSFISLTFCASGPILPNH